MIKEYPFDLNLISTRTQLFPDNICADDWVFYHGTSGVYEKQIEKEGLKLAPTVVSVENITRIVSIFEEMGWWGCDQGGFPVLKTFSLEHDLRNSASAIYFAESSYRGLLYATKDFAGGEKVRALRKCLTNLEDYLLSPALRNKHMETQRRDHNRRKRRDPRFGDPPPQEIDLDWLKLQVNSLREIKERCNETLENHAYGIVYAVKFSEADARHLFYAHSMGLESLADVSPKQLIAKARVPADWKFESRDDYHRMHKIMEGSSIAFLKQRQTESS